ncbi:hypothetical protein D3C78_1267620 [compost metagenome]
MCAGGFKNPDHQGTNADQQHSDNHARVTAVNAPKQRQHRTGNNANFQQAMVNQVQPAIVLPGEMSAGGIEPVIADSPVQLFVSRQPKEQQATDYQSQNLPTVKGCRQGVKGVSLNFGCC